MSLRRDDFKLIEEYLDIFSKNQKESMNTFKDYVKKIY